MKETIFKDWIKERKETDEVIFSCIEKLLTRVPIIEFEKRYKKWKK